MCVLAVTSYTTHNLERCLPWNGFRTVAEQTLSWSESSENPRTHFFSEQIRNVERDFYIEAKSFGAWHFTIKSYLIHCCFLNFREHEFSFYTKEVVPVHVLATLVNDKEI